MFKRYTEIKDYFLQNINPVIRYLIISDILIVGANGMLGPIFALFIEGNIRDANPAVVGISASVYLITKSLFQIPVAAIIDRIKGEKDDFYFMVIFSIAISIMPLLYLMVTESWQLYIVQFFLGLFTAMTFPSYMAIFTRHIDKNKQGTEWGAYFTMTDLSSAALAAIGGYIAFSLGFNVLIISVSLISLIGSLLLFTVKEYINLD